MSYSQGSEETAILQAVSGLETGTILDIGAAHPTTFSNSRALIERGWHAVLVEASPDHFMELYREYREHPNVDLILATVDVQWGINTLHHTKDLVSTTLHEHYAKWRSYAEFDGQFGVVTVPITDLYNHCLPVDVLSIDTEGTSALLCRQLLSAPQLAWPAVICVEHDSDPSLEREAAARGYRQIYRDPNNVVLAR